MTTKPRLLDLFCGAGGAAMGYHRAGFDVVGVDIRPQPRYPFEFHRGDALTWPLEGFDAIHASPPCQAFSALAKRWPDRVHPDLLTPTRAMLAAASIPWVIENVPGAPPPFGVRLCGTMFGLGVIRHRYFQCSFPPPIGLLTCRHHRGLMTVAGHGQALACNGHRGDRSMYSVDMARTAMGIGWMTRESLAQAIPPAYTEWIGVHLIAALRTAA